MFITIIDISPQIFSLMYWGPDLVNTLILISISTRKNYIRKVFCLFCKKYIYPALFHNFGCCYIILMGHKKIKKKWTIQYSLRSMVILRFFLKIMNHCCIRCGSSSFENGCQALVCQFIHEFYWIIEHPLDPAVCINMHPFLMYTSTWSGSCILITY